MKQSSGNKPAGGLGSRVVKHSSNPKVEPKARAVNPGAAAQLGSHLGNHATVQQTKGPLKGAGQPVYGGPGYSTPKGPTPQTAAGPGSGRVVHKSGSQSRHGEVVAGQGRSHQSREIMPARGRTYK
jgi:hypothetical protein